MCDGSRGCTVSSNQHRAHEGAAWFRSDRARRHPSTEMLNNLQQLRTEEAEDESLVRGGAAV